MKKARTFYMVTIILHFFFLFSCRGIEYADKYYNVLWSSSEPKIEFVVKTKEEQLEDNGLNFGYIMDGDSKIEIACAWTLSNGLDVFFKDCIISKNDNDIISEDDIAFRGNYTIHGNEIILIIDYDSVFDYKYDKITFIKKNLS